MQLHRYAGMGEVYGSPTERHCGRRQAVVVGAVSISRKIEQMNNELLF